MTIARGFIICFLINEVLMLRASQCRALFWGTGKVALKWTKLKLVNIYLGYLLIISEYILYLFTPFKLLVNRLTS